MLGTHPLAHSFNPHQSNLITSFTLLISLTYSLLNKLFNFKKNCTFFSHNLSPLCTIILFHFLQHSNYEISIQFSRCNLLLFSSSISKNHPFSQFVKLKLEIKRGMMVMMSLEVEEDVGVMGANNDYNSVGRTSSKMVVVGLGTANTRNQKWVATIDRFCWCL